MSDSRKRELRSKDEERDDHDQDDEKEKIFEVHDDLDDEDDDDDDESGSVGGSRIAIAKRKKNGFVANYLDEAKTVLTAPREFFRTMPVKGGFIQPLLFLFVSATVFSILQAISKLNFFVLFTAMFSSFVNVFVASAVIAFACSKMGGKGTFEGTFRVIAYGKATLLFAWLSLGPIPIGGIVSLIYSVYLNILGIEKVQKMPRKSVATLLIVIAVIGFIIKFRFGI